MLNRWVSGHWAQAKGRVPGPNSSEQEQSGPVVYKLQSSDSACAPNPKIGSEQMMVRWQVELEPGHSLMVLEPEPWWDGLPGVSPGTLACAWLNSEAQLLLERCAGQQREPAPGVRMNARFLMPD